MPDISTYMHTYIHTYIRTYIHTCLLNHLFTDLLADRYRLITDLQACLLAYDVSLLALLSFDHLTCFASSFIISLVFLHAYLHSLITMCRRLCIYTYTYMAKRRAAGCLVPFRKYKYQCVCVCIYIYIYACMCTHIRTALRFEVRGSAFGL